MAEMSKSDTLIIERIDALEKLMVGVLGSPWLTLEEAGRYLRCSKRKIEHLLASGRLPYFRLDPSLTQSRKLIHRKHLAAYLLTGKNSENDHLTVKEKRLVEELQ